MRPIIDETSGGNRVWRVLQKYNSVSQTTLDGKPLPDRVEGKTFFTFDKTFGEDATTSQVYEKFVRNMIVSSVVDGTDGVIVAYGSAGLQCKV